jgi:hypothetical protein
MFTFVVVLAVTAFIPYVAAPGIQNGVKAVTSHQSADSGAPDGSVLASSAINASDTSGNAALSTDLTDSKAPTLATDGTVDAANPPTASN